MADIIHESILPNLSGFHLWQGNLSNG